MHRPGIGFGIVKHPGNEEKKVLPQVHVNYLFMLLRRLSLMNAKCIVLALVLA